LIGKPTHNDLHCIVLALIIIKLDVAVFWALKRISIQLLYKTISALASTKAQRKKENAVNQDSEI